MSSTLYTAFSLPITVNIANPDHWINGHDMELPMGSKRCHLHPALKYTTTGPIDYAMYQVQLKMEQLKEMKMKFCTEQNRYVDHSIDHETKTVQVVGLPGFPENTWIRGSDLQLLDFSKVFFTKKSAPGEILVRPLIRYQPTVVIRDAIGNTFEFEQPTQTIIPISGKRKIDYNMPAVSMEEFEEPAPKRRAPAGEFEMLPMSSSVQFPQQPVAFVFGSQYAQPPQLATPEPIAQLPQFSEPQLPTAPPKRRRQLMDPSHPHFPHLDMMDYRGFTEEETISMYEAPLVEKETPSASNDILDSEIIEDGDALENDIEGFDHFLNSDEFDELMDKLDQQQQHLSFASCQ